MNSSLNRSLRESLNQKPDRIYFTVIKRGNIYHQRMTCVGNTGKPRASVTVSLRTKSAITAKANAEQLKNKLVSTNGALDCFDNARYTLKNLACTLSTPIGIPLGVPFSCPDNTPAAKSSSSIPEKPTSKPMTFADVAYTPKQLPLFLTVNAESNDRDAFHMNAKPNPVIPYSECPRGR